MDEELDDVIDDEVQETEEDERTEDDGTDSHESGADDSDPDRSDDDDDEEFDKSRAMAKIRKANREAASLRSRLKEAEAAQAELAKIKESQKSDSERLMDRVSSAESKVSELERQLNLKTIEIEFGLTESQVDRLKGDTLEELREDAETYIEDNKITRPARKAGPSADKVTGGRDPRTSKQKLDPAELAKKVRRR